MKTWYYNPDIAYCTRDRCEDILAILRSVITHFCIEQLLTERWLYFHKDNEALSTPFFVLTMEYICDDWAQPAASARNTWYLHAQGQGRACDQ